MLFVLICEAELREPTAMTASITNSQASGWKTHWCKPQMALTMSKSWGRPLLTWIIKYRSKSRSMRMYSSSSAFFFLIVIWRVLCYIWCAHGWMPCNEGLRCFDVFNVSGVDSTSHSTSSDRQHLLPRVTSHVAPDDQAHTRRFLSHCVPLVTPPLQCHFITWQGLLHTCPAPDKFPK